MVQSMQSPNIAAGDTTAAVHWAQRRQVEHVYTTAMRPDDSAKNF
jgi:hypothetical protein